MAKAVEPYKAFEEFEDEISESSEDVYVGPYVVLPKLRGSRLRPRSKVYEVVMEFLGLIWALG